MKQQYPGLVVIISFFFLVSCSKNKEGAIPSNPLAGTLWAGEFRYTTGPYLGVQPFSIALNSDSTVTWSDVTSTGPAGKFTVKANVVTLRFSNGTQLTATVSADKWTDFTNPAINGFAVENCYRGSVPSETTLENTTWQGQSGAYPLKVAFKAGSTLDYNIGSGSLQPGKYSIRGAGIYFTYKFTLSNEAFYGVFINNNTLLKGIQQSISLFPPATSYGVWNVQKQ